MDEREGIEARRRCEIKGKIHGLRVDHLFLIVLMFFVPNTVVRPRPSPSNRRLLDFITFRPW